MSRQTEDLPPRAQVEVLRHMADQPVPRLAMRDTAARYGVSVDGLQVWLRRHGYPVCDDMAAAADRLAATIEEPEPEAPVERPADPEPAAPPAEPQQAAQRPGDRLMRVRLTDVHPDPDNVRDGVGPDDDIATLAASIEEVGLLQPIVCRVERGRMVIVMGHRRHAALTLLGRDETDVIVRARPMRADEVLAAMLVENSARRDLDPIEEARAYRRLRREMSSGARQASAADVGRRVGRSQTVVSRRLTLLSLPSEHQQAVREGSLGLAAAERMAREESGTAGAKTPSRAPGHLSHRHPLAGRVMARCRDKGHGVKPGQSVGGIGCGECWEAVLRADERAAFVCPTCEPDDASVTP